MEKVYDIIVIGAGPGGVAAAKMAAEMGASVAIVEKDKIGGTCLHRGCIPTKALVHKAKIFKETKKFLKFFNDTGSFIFDEDFMNNCLKPDWSKIIEDGKRIITLNQKGLEASLKQAGVVVLHGEAEVLPDRQVKVVGDEEIILNYTEGVIIAMGSRPKRFEQFKDLEGDVVFYSDDVFNIEKFKELPKKLLIIGGGTMGCEFASIFANLGVEVTVVEMLPSLLSGIVDEGFVKSTIAREFKKKKINVLTGIGLKEIKKEDEKVMAILTDDKEVGTEKILIVAGRVPNDKIVQKPGKKSPDVHFIGDAFGIHGLAYTAECEGEIAAFNILCGMSDCLGKDVLVPYVIFSDPEIAVCGFREEQYASRSYKVAKYMYRALGKSHCDGDLAGEVKMIIHPETDKVIGVQICGANATEIIQTAYVLMSQGVPYYKWTEMLWPHPTYVEIFKEALKTIK